MTLPSGHDTPDPIGEAAQHWLLRLTSGDLTAAERRTFLEWRDADPRHLAAYEEVCSLWVEIDDLKPAFASSRSPEAVGWPAKGAVPPLRSDGSGNHIVARHGIAVGGLLAACIVLFVAVGSEWPARIMADESTGVGEQATVTLPDGSIVDLNTDTAIDIDYSDLRRQVWLRYGEAHFAVQKDAARPFDVLAAGGRTTAVGTAFVVRDVGGTATVTVTEGSATVVSPEAAGPGKSGSGTLIEAGQQLAYAQGQPPGPVRTLDAGSAAAWRQGIVLIQDQPLAEALAEIDRYHSGRIVLFGNAASLQPVTARISLQDIDSGIDALAATHDLVVTRLTNYLTVLRQNSPER